MTNPITIELLQKIIQKAALNQEGNNAQYIPELAKVDSELMGIAVAELKGNTVVYCNKTPFPITLQSTGKLVVLIGLLEEFGIDYILKWVKVEPSGDDFASITRLERFGPKPSNPMLNSGAITLCSHIPGTPQQQYDWLNHWIKTLFNHPLKVNERVFISEKKTGDRNRSIAYFLKSRNHLLTDADQTLDLYFTLCSYEALLEETLYLPTLLANGGKDPHTGAKVISADTCKITLAIMATCGLYDETGTHMVKTGMPAKSGVSGYTLAVLPGKAGIVTLSPRINQKGNSIRGGIMLEELSKLQNWHFALPG